MRRDSASQYEISETHTNSHRHFVTTQRIEFLIHQSVPTWPRSHIGFKVAILGNSECLRVPPPPPPLAGPLLFFTNHCQVPTIACASRLLPPLPNGRLSSVPGPMLHPPQGLATTIIRSRSSLLSRYSLSFSSAFLLSRPKIPNYDFASRKANPLRQLQQIRAAVAASRLFRSAPDTASCPHTFLHTTADASRLSNPSRFTALTPDAQDRPLAAARLVRPASQPTCLLLSSIPT